jgi:uncharacterized damage-inducible protein DinB
MLSSVQAFVRYFESVRRRTWTTVDRITPETLDWAPRSGEFTCGEIIRHLAGAERFFVTRVVEDRWTDNLEPGPVLDYAATRARLETAHNEEVPRLLALPDHRLHESTKDLDGGDVKVWRFLMAMVEHEVHHRSQLDCWLSAAGVEPPQLYGYRMEDVVARVRASAGGETSRITSSAL